jgi:hypothetical protein
VGRSPTSRYVHLAAEEAKGVLGRMNEEILGKQRTCAPACGDSLDASGEPR